MPAPSKRRVVRQPQSPDLIEIVKFLQEHDDALAQYEKYRRKLRPFGVDFHLSGDTIVPRFTRR